MLAGAARNPGITWFFPNPCELDSILADELSQAAAQLARQPKVIAVKQRPRHSRPHASRCFQRGMSRSFAPAPMSWGTPDESLLSCNCCHSSRCPSKVMKKCQRRFFIFSDSNSQSSAFPEAVAQRWDGTHQGRSESAGSDPSDGTKIFPRPNHRPKSTPVFLINIDSQRIAHHVAPGESKDCLRQFCWACQQRRFN